MPSPASEAIASDRGHGALGVRYGLRPFRDLLGETVGQRHLWMELRPKMVLASWNTDDTAPPYHYWKAVAETFDGIPLAVVGVSTLSESLVQVESEAVCAATDGTFYYDGAKVYVRLTGAVDPASTVVVALIGIHVGSHGVYQPILGRERLANGTFEAWTGATPDGWSLNVNTIGGSSSQDKTTSDPLQGSYACRVTLTSFNGYRGFYQLFTGSSIVPGLIYRFSGAYRIATTDGTSRVQVFVSDNSGNYLYEDGRTVGNPSGFAFQDLASLGQWQRFSFDFVVPAGWTSVNVEVRAYANAGAGTIDFDDVKLQPVSRYAFYEPLLSVESLPTIEAARADAFWGQLSSAIGSMSLLNGGGRLEPLLAAYDWIGADAIVRVGGRYQLGGNEVLLDDCPVIASAKLGAPAVSDPRVTFDLGDDRKLLQVTLPLRTYNNNSGTDAYNQVDRGKSRACLWGTKLGIRPVQYDIHYPYSGPVPLGKYELIDCSDWAVGIKEITRVWWYEDDQAAANRSIAQRVEIVTSGTDYSDAVVVALTTGRFDVYRDCRPLVIAQDNNKAIFDTGGSPYTLVLSVGAFPLYHSLALSGITGLLANMQNGITGLGVAGVYVNFLDSSQKVRWQKDAVPAVLNLRCATGADVQSGLWSVLGYDASTDKTGGSTYTADVVFTQQAISHTVRVDAIGYKDDASGTYTGTPSAVIEKAPDIVHHILRVFLKVPSSAIDLPSFVAARSVATRPCSLLIQAPRTVAEIFEELETSGNMDIVLKGGVWYCLTRDATVPTGTPALVDADFLSFEAGYALDDLFGTVTLTYNESPDGGDAITFGRAYIGYLPHSRTEMGQVTDASIALRFNRPDQRTFRTCLRDAADATYPLSGTRLEEIAAEAGTLRRRFTLRTKGKALQVPINGKLVLTRAKGLDTTGALSSVLVRVLSKRDDWARWASEIVAVEVV